MTDLIRSPEQESGFAGFDHGQIVETVTAGNGLKSDGLQGFYGGKLGIGDPHPVSGDLAAFGNFQ